MPSRPSSRNRPGVRKLRKAEMTVSPSSTNGDFLKGEFDEEWKQSRVLRCSYRVLQLIGNATLTEKVIREALGNNPDTSKALRLLVRRKMIKRVGYGGRSCPFHYQSLSRSPSKDTDDKAELTSSSSAENTDAMVEERDDKTKSIAIAPVKRETFETNGKEAHEIVVSPRIKVSKTSKEPKKPQVKSAAGLKPSAAPVAKATSGGLVEIEIPVPGWRLVDD